MCFQMIDTSHCLKSRVKSTEISIFCIVVDDKALHNVLTECVA